MTLLQLVGGGGTCTDDVTYADRYSYTCADYVANGWCGGGQCLNPLYCDPPSQCDDGSGTYTCMDACCECGGGIGGGGGGGTPGFDVDHIPCGNGMYDASAQIPGGNRIHGVGCSSTPLIYNQGMTSGMTTCFSTTGNSGKYYMDSGTFIQVMVTEAVGNGVSINVQGVHDQFDSVDTMVRDTYFPSPRGMFHVFVGQTCTSNPNSGQVGIYHYFFIDYNSRNVRGRNSGDYVNEFYEVDTIDTGYFIGHVVMTSLDTCIDDHEPFIDAIESVFLKMLFSPLGFRYSITDTSCIQSSDNTLGSQPCGM